MRRVVLAVFEGAQGLDLFGPAEVFGAAGRHVSDGGYEVVVASMGGATIRVTSGVPITTRDLARIRPLPSDTVLVVGGDDPAIRGALRDAALVRWLSRAASVAKRVGSVCSGAFVLAKTGVLDGLRVATHWSACDRLATFRPSVTVDRESIFVRQGRVWSSAGVTAGIDMALAIVEEDYDRRVADAIAARFVLYARRPGFQSQFSDALVAQRDASDPLGPVVAWTRQNLRRPIDVGELARRAGMSVRTLHRRCHAALGATPAKLVEKLRIEHARTLLTTTTLGTKTIASQCGFGSAPRMARAFERAFGVAPREYRALHGGRARAEDAPASGPLPRASARDVA